MQTTPMMRRQVLTATAGAVGAAVIGSRPRRSYARQEQVTLRWWDYYSQGANNEATQNQLKRYMEANPHVTIERTPIPFADLKQKLLQGAAAGDLPDISVIDNPDHQAFAALGILEDLTDRVAEWGRADAYFAGPWGLHDLAGTQLRHPRQQQLPGPLAQHRVYGTGGGRHARELG